MLDLQEINNTIESLENGITTFDVCNKLASLYIVREYMQKSAHNNNVETELKDILPRYREYCDIRRRYQLGEVGEIAVQNAMQYVCKEIKEFMQSLYTSTYNDSERAMLRNLIADLKEVF